MVAIEYIKDFGEGELYFSAGFGCGLYLTHASADSWKKWAIKTGMGVVAIEEE